MYGESIENNFERDGIHLRRREIGFYREMKEQGQLSID